MEPGTAGRYVRPAMTRVELQGWSAGAAEAELVTNSDTDAVNLEHILPQTPSTDWSNFNEEIALKYYNRIGNLTLMRSRSNSSVGNDSFASKRLLYKSSNIRITREIAKYHEWGIDEIEKRQKKLAELAVKAWPNKVL